MNMPSQEDLNKIWDTLKEGGKFTEGEVTYPPKINIDDEVEQVMTVPLPNGGGIVVSRKNENAEWTVKEILP